jgi:hypothetical protein
MQKIEDAYSVAGKTVTLSFYARSSSATPIITVRGGLAYVDTSYIIPPQDTAVQLSGQWARYSVTFDIDTLQGISVPETTSFRIYLEALHDGDYDYANVQLEIGDTATPFEHRPLGLELELCKRYYEKVYYIGPGTVMNASTAACICRYSPKRIKPSLSYSGTVHMRVGAQGISGCTMTATSIEIGSAYVNVTVPNGYTLSPGDGCVVHPHYTQPSSYGYIEVNAEL